MRQLVQKLKDGRVELRDLPIPVCGPGMVLVKSHYSLVSAGTEGSTVRAARKSLIGKAKERPQQVKQVIDVLRTQGVGTTIRTVAKKLESLSPLGYSCVGEVVEVGDGVTKVSRGSIVACGGNTANHAEFVAVPEMLCVEVPQSDQLPRDKQLRNAAYNTLGAIALQGVRQADLRLGESCVVIGLGLLGQITCQLLKSSGVRVAGVDVAESAVGAAVQNGVEFAALSGESSLSSRIEQHFGGTGADAVIITAASPSTAPINFAGEVCRQRGRVVVVGDVPTGFDRNPHFYEKELDVKMSCSYGPGRYDPDYEQKGHDYPLGYVRWTENRNMMAFQDLIARGAIDLDCLTTHEFELESAPNAYDMIVGGTEPHLGVLIRYDVPELPASRRIDIRPEVTRQPISLAVIGAGNYSQGFLLPNLPSVKSGLSRKIVMTNSGATSRGVAERFDFQSCTSNASDIFDGDDVNTVLVSTRHDSHADFVIRAIDSGKHVLVDKPLCITENELNRIQDAIASAEKVPHVMVGYNRRFSPLGLELKQRLPSEPMAMLYRVNAGQISPKHWIQDPEIGGGRIIGEVCHFIDFMTFVCDGLPSTVSAVALPDAHGLRDCVHINLGFDNGSTGSIAYLANGATSVDKEYFEAFCHGQTARLLDFKTLEWHGGGRPSRKRLVSQDKGQAEMLKRFFSGLGEGNLAPISLAETVRVSEACFAVLESLRSQKTIRF